MTAKADLRRWARAHREATLDGREAELAAAVAQHFLDRVPLADGACVAAYHALPGELDPGPLVAVLHERGHVIGLPTVLGPGVPLAFRRWAPGDPMVRGSFAVEEPLPTAEMVLPDVVIVPLLAWDRRGNRLGYGGGYYDRTLSALAMAWPIREPGALTAPRAIGYALSAQEVPEVPVGMWDVQLDAVVTEDEVMVPRK